MQFLFPILTWGFLLALVPLLIHLINMMRHRRVKWAAMEFLLQSYKKHRKWVWLKQLLLLLMRMAAIALLVMMLAQWLTQGQWLDLFGGKVQVPLTVRTVTGAGMQAAAQHSQSLEPLLPSFHPAYLLRSPREKRSAWSDLKAVLAKLGEAGS